MHEDVLLDGNLQHILTKLIKLLWMTEVRVSLFHAIKNQRDQFHKN